MRKILPGAIISLLLLTGCVNTQARPFLMPHLPQPIADTRAIVTPAGQGAEGLIISQMASKLFISNRFWRKVRGQDLSERYDCLIVTVGMSQRNMDKLGVGFEQEKQRLITLAQTAKERQMAVVVVSVDKLRRRDKTDDITQAIAPYTDYYLIIGDANYDNFFGKLAKRHGIPITVVRDFERAKTPLNSIFR